MTRCTCDQCWKKFATWLQEKDPVFYEGFAKRLRHRWEGFLVHQENK